MESGALYHIGGSVKSKKKNTLITMLTHFHRFRGFQDSKNHYDYPAWFVQQSPRIFTCNSSVKSISCGRNTMYFCNTTHSSSNSFEVAENPSCPQINRTSSQPLSWVSLNLSSSSHPPLNIVMSLSTRLKTSLYYQKIVFLCRYVSTAIRHILTFSLCLII